MGQPLWPLWLLLVWLTRELPDRREAHLIHLGLQVLDLVGVQLLYWRLRIENAGTLLLWIQQRRWLRSRRLATLLLHVQLSLRAVCADDFLISVLIQLAHLQHLGL